MKYPVVVVFIMLALFSAIVITISESPNIHSNDYPAKKLPGLEKEIFSPGIISTGLNERDFAMNPAGSEILYTVMWRGYSVICLLEKKSGKWSVPEVVEFSGDPRYYDAEPHFSQDGGTVFFLSTRPLPGDEYHPGWGYEHIWYTRKEGGSWSEPHPIEMPVEENMNYYYPSLTRNGDMYLSASERDSRETYIYKSELKNGVFQQPKKLPGNVNASTSQYNACIDPEERFILFCAAGGKDNLNHADIFVCFNDKGNRWSKPVNLGEKVNFEGATAQSVSLTPDGMHIVFAASHLKLSSEPGKLTYKKIQGMHNSHSNGFSDLYWIDSSILEDLKKQAEY